MYLNMDKYNYMYDCEQVDEFKKSIEERCVNEIEIKIVYDFKN